VTSQNDRMTALFHLTLQTEWSTGQREGRYTPARFASDGFLHATADREVTLEVARAYFLNAVEPVLVVQFDPARLDVPLKWEAPAPPDGQLHAHHTGRTFPHVYGSLPLSSVVQVAELVRLADGFGWPDRWAEGA
jgi:uncharacterized protein (DUF952 family)